MAYEDAFHVDIESFSRCSLKKAGLYRYAEDLSTEILCVCYARGREPVNLWIPWFTEEWHGEFPETLRERLVYELVLEYEELGDIFIQPECPDDLKNHAASGGELRAHNAQFERVMLNARPGRKIGFPKTSREQWVCTAAKMAAHSLPRALGNAAKALGTFLKDEDGKLDMMALCKPRTGKVERWTPQNAPDRYYRMYRYCVGDVLAEQGVDLAVPDLPPSEQEVFAIDQEINDRGVAIDIPAIENVKFLIDEYKGILEKNCKELTGGISPSQTARLAEWVRGQGFPIENLQAATMREALNDESMPKNVRKVLTIRLLHSMKAVSKYDSMLDAVSEDGRLHGMFLYHGAATGRWSSLRVQLQNLFRPVVKDPELAIEAFSLRDLQWIKFLYDSVDPMKVFASCVRGMLVPGEDKDLIAMDYSAIEARVTAWLAGQEDILEVFREHGLIYEHTAAKVYAREYPGGASLEQLKEMEKKHWMRRFVGKTCVLALGYQGGAGAFAKMAKQYGVDISEEEADEIKIEWRKSNPKIVGLWYDIEEAATLATIHEGVVYSIPNKRIKFYKPENSQFLYMRLPSGRKLAYFEPKIDGNGQLTYLGIDTYTRRWMRCNTYGGKLTENAVQAIARDLLVSAMKRLRKRGYDIVGTVHDEVILEVPKGFGSPDEVSEIMCEIDDWAKGLPVQAAGWRGPRYRK